MRDGQLRRTKPEAVPPLRKKMKLRRNLLILERLKIDKSVLDVSRVVVLSLKQKRRRYLRIRQKSRIHLAVRAAEPARVNDHLKVGTGVDGRCRNILTLKIRMSTEDRSKIRPSGEANNPDAVRVNVPLRGVSASEPHSLLRVFQIFDIFRVVTLFRHAILHQNASHTKRVEPVADLGSLKIVRKSDVTSAWKDQSGCTIILLRLRRVDGNAGFANVCNANGQFAGDHAIGICSWIDLRANDLRGLRVAIGPEEQRMLLGQSRDGKEQNENSRSHGRIVEQINERNKWLFDIAPILTNPHISNNRD